VIKFLFQVQKSLVLVNLNRKAHGFPGFKLGQRRGNGLERWVVLDSNLCSVTCLGGLEEFKFKLPLASSSVREGEQFLPCTI
jgi:hypothetical protein